MPTDRWMKSEIPCRFSDETSFGDGSFFAICNAWLAKCSSIVSDLQRKSATKSTGAGKIKNILKCTSHSAERCGQEVLTMFKELVYFWLSQWKRNRLSLDCSSFIVIMRICCFQMVLYASFSRFAFASSSTQNTKRKEVFEWIIFRDKDIF